MVEKNLMHGMVRIVFGDYATWMIKNSRTVMIGVAIVAASSVSLYFFYQRQAGLQQQAFVALQEALDEFSKMQEGDIEKMNDAQALAVAGKQQFGSTAAGSYFDLIAAHVALSQGDRALAQTLLSKSFTSLSSDNPLYSLVGTLSARLLLESESAADQEQGVSLLEKMANDAANKQRDVAQYYLACWYQDHGKTSQAQALFKTLAAMKSQEKNDVDQSPWASAAQEFVR